MWIWIRIVPKNRTLNSVTKHLFRGREHNFFFIALYKIIYIEKHNRRFQVSRHYILAKRVMLLDKENSKL